MHANNSSALREHVHSTAVSITVHRQVGDRELWRSEKLIAVSASNRMAVSNTFFGVVFRGNALLDLARLPWDILSERLLVWEESKRYEYRLRDRFEGHLDDAAVVTHMVDAGAYPDTDNSYTAMDISSGAGAAEHRCIGELLDLQLVERIDGGMWRFTHAGQAQLELVNFMHSPRPAAQVRAGHVPVHQMSALELIKKLERAGWTQEQWKSKQRPAPYRADGPTIWYVKTGYNIWYLRALAAVAKLFAKGLKELLHFKPPPFYKAFFLARRGNSWFLRR